MRHRRFALFLPTMLMLFACSPDDLGSKRGDLQPGPGIPPEEEAAWITELEQARAEKDEEFATSETSPMAGTQYLKSERAEEVYLTRNGSTFGLSYAGSPTAVLSVTREEPHWRWQALDSEIGCRRGEEVVPSGSSIEGPATFLVANLHLSFYPADERVTFIVFDPERAEMAAFERLLYFPPDPAFAVRAELVPFEDPKVIEVVTSRDLRKTFYQYARIRFRLEGKEQNLTALKYALEGEGSEQLFIPFRDSTSGRESYGAGRFLEIEEPTERLFVLDFNRAFNPLCNYSPAYNCALPPRENHLEVAVRAGERSYPH